MTEVRSFASAVLSNESCVIIKPRRFEQLNIPKDCDFINLSFIHQPHYVDLFKDHPKQLLKRQETGMCRGADSLYYYKYFKDFEFVLWVLYTY